MNSQQYHMMRVVQKIRAFQGFQVDEVLRLLHICRATVYRAGDVIYRRGETSEEMLILLTGKVHVVGETGEILAELGPGASTGEMGLFTGHPRSADVVAVERSSCLLLRKGELSNLVNHDPSMHLKLVYNIIALLSERLDEANRLNEKLALRLEQYQAADADDLDAGDADDFDAEDAEAGTATADDAEAAGASGLSHHNQGAGSTSSAHGDEADDSLPSAGADDADGDADEDWE